MHRPDGCALEIKQVGKLNGWFEACPSAQPFIVPCAMDVFDMQTCTILKTRARRYFIPDSGFSGFTI